MSAGIIGKTYSLYGGSDTTESFYNEVNTLTDSLLFDFPDKNELLKQIRRAEKRIKYAKPFLIQVEPTLSKYITDIEKHLGEISIFQRFGSVLSKKKYQYLLNMIEFNLTNRIFLDDFLKAEKIIALLPHCLRDLTKNCKSEIDGLDFVCKRCSKNCFINKVSTILSAHDIKPYIWMEASRATLFSNKKQNVKSLGLLGIACIPELINGMRHCTKKNIPVVGIPLDANRCKRWMGDFYDNSVNLSALEKLLSRQE